MSLNLSLLSRITLSGRALESDSLFNETHLSGEGGVRNPGTGVAGRHFFEHSVDLLEGKSLCLWHEEICEEHTDDAKGAPHEEDFGG
jgi:hypothetical protein